MDETSQDTGLFWPEGLLQDGLAEAVQAPVVLPPEGKFAGLYQGYIVVPQPLIDAVVEYSEAEPAAFGSYAALGPYGSFELRHSDLVTNTALTTWPGVTDFYYGRDKHMQPILEALGIPIIALKKDFLHAYERVITELGQI